MFYSVYSGSQDLVAETAMFPSVATCVCGLYRDSLVAWRTPCYVRPLPSVHSLWGGGGGRVLCGGALGVLVFCGAAEGNTSTSRKTQEPIACSSDEDVLCINIKIVFAFKNERRRAIK